MLSFFIFCQNATISDHPHVEDFTNDINVWTFIQIVFPRQTFVLFIKFSAAIISIKFLSPPLINSRNVVSHSHSSMIFLQRKTMKILLLLSIFATGFSVAQLSSPSTLAATPSTLASTTSSSSSTSSPSPSGSIQVQDFKIFPYYKTCQVNWGTALWRAIFSSSI